MQRLRAALANLIVVRTLALLALVLSVMKPSAKRGFMANAAAFISLGPVLAVVGTVLGLIVLVLVVAGLAGDFFNATIDITDAFNNSGLTGTAGVIAGIVAILVPIALLFALAAIILKKVG